MDGERIFTLSQHDGICGPLDDLSDWLQRHRSFAALSPSPETKCPPVNLSPTRAIMFARASALSKSSISRRPLSSSARRLAQNPPSIDPKAAKETKISANYNRPQVPTPRHGANTNPLPILPLVAIFFTGSFLFWKLSKSREGSGKSHYVLPPRDSRPRPEKAFNSNIQSEH